MPHLESLLDIESTNQLGALAEIAEGEVASDKLKD
jgi:hypothetical protein